MNSPDHSTKGTPLAWRVGDPTTPSRLRLLVGARFQGLFHPPCGVLFTVPSRYSCTIGGSWYLALEGGPPSFPQDFACPVVLRYTATATGPVGYGALTRLWPGFPAGSPDRPALAALRGALQPRRDSRRAGLGCSRFARHYYGNLVLMSRPRSTEMFQFLRCPSLTLCIQVAIRPLARVFGVGCPIRIRTAHRLHAAPRPRFAGLRVLLRPRAPRHPPNTPPSLAFHALFSSVTMCVDPSSEASHPTRWMCDALSFSHSARFGKIEAITICSCECACGVMET